VDPSDPRIQSVINSANSPDKEGGEKKGDEKKKDGA
jgi:hypothetical protein